MAATDWQLMSSGLTADNVKSGATAGVVAPNGGAPHVFGMRSVSAQPGVFGVRCIVSNFNPIPANKGGRITGALKRPIFGAADGFAPFFFFGATDPDVSAQAYILGLSDEPACHIQLRKGALQGGLPAVSVVDPDAAPNVLLRSSNTFAADIWHHLRLDVIVQGTGDVVLQVYRNDLAVNSVTAPVWQPVPGMEGGVSSLAGFVDDALGINTGSSPLVSGYLGFGTRFETSGRAAYFDHITCERQL